MDFETLREICVAIKECWHDVFVCSVRSVRKNSGREAHQWATAESQTEPVSKLHVSFSNSYNLQHSEGPVSVAITERKTIHNDFFNVPSPHKQWIMLTTTLARSHFRSFFFLFISASRCPMNKLPISRLCHSEKEV